MSRIPDWRANNKRGLDEVRMRIRQFSDLIEGEVVAERQYSEDDPDDITGVLKLVLANCSDLIKQEGIPLDQDSIELTKMEFRYPGVAGTLQVLFAD